MADDNSPEERPHRFTGNITAMKLIVGLIIVFASVFGGFILSSGSMMALFQPFELLIIGGRHFDMVLLVVEFNVFLPFKM